MATLTSEKLNFYTLLEDCPADPSNSPFVYLHLCDEKAGWRVRWSWGNSEELEIVEMPEPETVGVSVPDYLRKQAYDCDRRWQPTSWEEFLRIGWWPVEYQYMESSDYPPYVMCTLTSMHQDLRISWSNNKFDEFDVERESPHVDTDELIKKSWVTRLISLNDDARTLFHLADEVEDYCPDFETIEEAVNEIGLYMALDNEAEAINYVLKDMKHEETTRLVRGMEGDRRIFFSSPMADFYVKPFDFTKKFTELILTRMVRETHCGFDVDLQAKPVLRFWNSTDGDNLHISHMNVSPLVLASFMEWDPGEQKKLDDHFRERWADDDPMEEMEKFAKGIFGELEVCGTTLEWDQPDDYPPTNDIAFHFWGAGNLVYVCAVHRVFGPWSRPAAFFIEDEALVFTSRPAFEITDGEHYWIGIPIHQNEWEDTDGNDLFAESFRVDENGVGYSPRNGKPLELVVND